MPGPISEARSTVQRRLDQRQQLANAAIAALAHGRRNTDDLYAQLCELEGALESEYPRVVARNYGTWATQDAQTLADHQSDSVRGCDHCAAANTPATVSELVRTA